MILFTAAWWDAMGVRAANTAIAVLLPLAALLVSGEASPLTVLSLVAVQVLLVLATSLGGLPEITGRTIPLWRAVLVRTAKTAGQSLATALVGVTLLDAIDWKSAGVLIGGATLATLLRTLRDYLPETTPEAIIGTLSDDGTATITTLPPTA